MKRATLIKLCIALAFFALFVFGRGYFKQASTVDAQATASPKTVAVDVVSLQENYEVRRRFSGRLTASNVSDLGFSQGGAVTALMVKDGDRVKRGQVIAKLDLRQTTADRDALLASRDEVKATLTEAETAFNRLEPLVPISATPQRLDELRRERDRARASLKRIDAQIASLKARQDDLLLRAAFEGQVVERFIETGTVVAAGQPIVRVNGGAGLEAHIGVPATLRGEFSVGKSYVLINAGRVGTGTLISVIDNVNSYTQTITLVLSVSDAPDFTASGLVELDTVISKTGRGVWIDAGALSESLKGLWSVYTVKPEANSVVKDVGKIARNDVEVLHIDDSGLMSQGH